MISPSKRWRPIVRDAKPGSPLEMLDWVGPAVERQNGVGRRGSLSRSRVRNRK